MSKSAVLYRMVSDQHLCPFGLKSLDLLKRKDFEIEDKILRTRDETDQFMQVKQVDTTPQTFIDGKRVGATTSYTN